MTTYCFWDEIEDNVVREYDENNSTIASYTTEPTIYGSVLSQDRGGEVRHYQFDGLGNTTELTDDSGNVTDTRRYSAIGEMKSSTGSTSFPWQFGAAHGYYTGTEIHVLEVRVRLLLPSLGQWMSVDPLQVLSLSRSEYVFANNNPIRFVDPAGLWPGTLPVREQAEKRETGNCGKYAVRWSVTFEKDADFAGGAPCKGMLLQDVWIYEKLIECACKDCPPEELKVPKLKYHYYELLGYIEKGGKGTEQELRLGNSDKRGIGIERQNTCGNSLSWGEMRFICLYKGMEKDIAEVEGWKTGRQQGLPAGSFKASETEPALWKNYGAKLSRKPRTQVKWDCCNQIVRKSDVRIAIE